MATVTGLTAARMLAIEAESVIGGEIVGGHLILVKFDTTEIDAGIVVGPEGPPGPPGGLIPGEIRMWSGEGLPDISYGWWVWADGASYPVVSHPLAADYISDSWRTFDGASDPGGTNFRVPDMRGLVPAGLDAMPGGTRKNRMTRSVAIILAEKTGEETHVITVPEMASHTHQTRGDRGSGGDLAIVNGITYTGWEDGFIANTGGDDPHENVQPTVFIPYIVFLDDSGV